MHKDLTLQERLKIAKHFRAGFELEPNDVEWLSIALERLRTGTIERCDAENLYIMKELEITRSKQRRVYAYATVVNVSVWIAAAAGAFYWLM